MHYSTAARRRMLTFAAIAMVISSSLISFFLVQKNDRMIAELRRTQEKTEQTIMTLWNNAETAERHADASVIVSLLTRDDPATLALRQYYLERTGLAANAGTMEMVKAADKTRKAAVDKVNDYYLTHLDAENEIMARESMNKRYADFAFLLQLISLVLVILTREMPNG